MKSNRMAKATSIITTHRAVCTVPWGGPLPDGSGILEDAPLDQVGSGPAMDTVQTALWVVMMLVALAILFDFMNGFHDAANSIATVVSTGVLRPGQAVVFAAFFNFIAIFVFHLSV